MLRSLAVASGLVIGALALGGSGASAAMSVPNQSVQSESDVTQVGRRSCRFWHRECRARHGGGWDFRRCMRRHGC
jgi:hypothetical protein